MTSLPSSTIAPRQAPWSPSPAAVITSTIAGLVVVAAYTGGVLMPYLLADLHLLSYAELTSGAHDPKALWPAGAGALGALLHMSGALAAVLGALITAPAAAVSAHAARSALTRHARRRALVHLLVAVLLAASTVLRFTPLGSALVTWIMD